MGGALVHRSAVTNYDPLHSGDSMPLGKSYYSRGPSQKSGKLNQRSKTITFCDVLECDSVGFRKQSSSLSLGIHVLFELESALAILL